jgi:hypothetical protein
MSVRYTEKLSIVLWIRNKGFSMVPVPGTPYGPILQYILICDTSTQKLDLDLQLYFNTTGNVNLSINVS